MDGASNEPRPALVERWRALLKSRGGRAVLVGYSLVALVGAFLPLLDHLGFELALGLTIASAVLAPMAGVAAIRLEFLRPVRTRPVLAAFAAMTFSVLALAIPTVLILLNGIRRPVCDPFGGLLWMLVLPLPTAALGAALGAFARARGQSARRAAALVVAVEVASLAVGLWSVYGGPAFYLYDHFFGYYPGPLYDETVLLGAPVLVFRAFTLMWAVAAMLGTGQVHEDPRKAARYSVLALSLAIALMVTSLAFGEEIGFRTTDRSLAAALGAEKRVDDLEIHYPKEWSDKQVDQLVRDATFRAAQVETLLAVKPSRPVRVWMYRSPDEKRRLVGAAATSFAKPWRHEVHVHASGFPHPVIRHELVHAFAADVADGAFHVPGGLFPNSPFIEGFAVAFDAEPEGMTNAQWAKAMRDLGLAPDVAALLSTQGFYASAPSRAYSYAGAFIRFLREKHGLAKVLELYRTGELSSIGDPQALVKEFEASLDALPIRPDEKAAAERRFSRPSVFHRKCAREVAAVTDEARDRLGKNENVKALDLYAEACDMEPDDPALVRGLLTAALRAKEPAKRKEAENRLFSHPKLDASLKASALIELGDDAWKSADLAGAAAKYAEAAALEVEPATHRSALARVRAVSDPGRAGLLRPLLVDGNADVGQLFAMSDYLNAHPDDALVAYLLGRQLAQRDGPVRGAQLLAETLGHLEDRELERESMRVLVRALSEAHQCERAAAMVLPMTAAAPADGAFARDWVERCEFEKTRGLPGVER